MTAGHASHLRSGRRGLGLYTHWYREACRRVRLKVDGRCKDEQAGSSQRRQPTLVLISAMRRHVRSRIAPRAASGRLGRPQRFVQSACIDLDRMAGRYLRRAGRGHGGESVAVAFLDRVRQQSRQHRPRRAQMPANDHGQPPEMAGVYRRCWTERLGLTSEGLLYSLVQRRCLAALSTSRRTRPRVCERRSVGSAAHARRACASPLGPSPALAIIRAR